MSEVDEIKRALRKNRKKESVPDSDFLSTGSTLVNLACTGRVDGGFTKGRYFFIVGDSASGKTFLSLTCLAEASINPAFKDYRFIYDNSEDGCLMDIEKFFGSGVMDRMEPPASEDDSPIYSGTIEEFYYHVDDAIREGKPFIYILDSMDALSSEAEGEKFEQHKRAYRKGKEAPGSYGDGKAKVNSSNLRKLLSPLRDSGSILIIINQTRDNLGFGFEKKTRSGGHALRFYACIELWSSVEKKLKKRIKGKDRQLGALCKVQVKKNRITGRERTVSVPIFFSTGIDDVGSCVDYLIDEGDWEQSKKGRGEVIEAGGLGPVLKMSRSKLISHIEDEEMEDDLRALVGTAWGEVEKACEVKRKKRY